MKETLSFIILETNGILDTGVIESVAQRVKEILSWVNSLRLPEITCAASLAHHGLLGSVERLRLYMVDLTLVPAEHLASLASSVTGFVDIRNVRGLVTILDSVKCGELKIWSQSLDSEETQALVRAMESGVEEVKLFWEVSLLEIRVLMEYSGQGRCRRVECNFDPAEGYREQLKTWAKSRNWDVNRDNAHYNNNFVIERI